jgi:hypothetical protein
MTCVEPTSATTALRVPEPAEAPKLYAPAVRLVTGVVCPSVLETFELKAWNEVGVTPESNWVTTEEASTWAL